MAMSLCIVQESWQAVRGAVRETQVIRFETKRQERSVFSRPACSIFRHRGFLANRLNGTYIVGLVRNCSVRRIRLVRITDNKNGADYSSEELGGSLS